MTDELFQRPIADEYMTPELLAVLRPQDADLVRDTLAALLRPGIDRWDLARYLGRLVGSLGNHVSDLERIAEITDPGGRLVAPLREAFTELLLIAKAPRLTEDERRELGRTALERRGLLRYGTWGKP